MKAEPVCSNGDYNLHMKVSSQGKVSNVSWLALFMMTLVYTLNIADRFVLSTLIEPIKSEFALSDAAVGFLTGTSLAIFYVCAGLPLGALADRVNRKNMIAVSLSIWSGMTAVCGLSTTFTHLLLARIGVGIGEAGGTPPFAYLGLLPTTLSRFCAFCCRAGGEYRCMVRGLRSRAT